MKPNFYDIKLSSMRFHMDDKEVNCYDLNEFLDDYIKEHNHPNDLLHMIPKNDCVFVFEVNKDTDVLQSYELRNKRYSIATYMDWSGGNFSSPWNLKSWKDINRELLKKSIERSENAKYLHEAYICSYSLDMPSIEFPHRIHLCGLDDSSYTRCYATKEEAVMVLKLIKTNNKINSMEFVEQLRFIFTN